MSPRVKINNFIWLLFFMVFIHPSYAAIFEPGVTRDNLAYMKISGNIEAGDAQEFRYILDQWAGKNVPIQVVDLNSDGGSLVEAYLILQSVLNDQISTIVMPGSHCISACVSIFAAGKTRYADPGSIVGVHRASEDGEDTTTARSASIDMIKIYQELSIPTNIRLNMIETDPSQVYYLTPADKAAFNIVGQDTTAATSTIQHSSVQIKEKKTTKESKKEARSLNAQGITLINQQQFNQAIRVLEQAKSLTPTDAEILGNLGYAYYMAGNLDSAQNALTSSLTLKPNRGSSWNNLGLVLAARGDASWAADAFVKYWYNSRNKKAATNQFFYWENVSPGTVLEQASRMARAQLGLANPVN